MYPWLFERWDCGRVEDNDEDNETSAVRMIGKKHYNQPRGRRGGGEERYGSAEGVRMGGRGSDHHRGSSRRS